MGNKNKILWVLLFLWQLPQNIVALCMLPFLGERTRYARKRYAICLYCKGMVGKGSISLGSFVFLGSYDDKICAHELGHVLDSHKFGPLYLFTIGICSLWWAVRFKSGNYFAFWTEERANKNSYLAAYPNVYESWYYLKWEDGYSFDSIGEFEL